MNVAAGLEAVRRRVERAAETSGRSPSDVTVVAVTKGFPAGVVADAVAAGAVDLGENRAQELREKAIAVSEGVRWHFIGHLQTNKVRHVVGTAVAGLDPVVGALVKRGWKRGRAALVVEDTVAHLMAFPAEA